MRQNHILDHNLKISSGEKFNQMERLGREETAVYIADMLLELRNLAKMDRFTTLQGLLEIAYYEAFSSANKINIPEGENEFLHSLGEDVRRANGA